MLARVIVQRDHFANLHAKMQFPFSNIDIVVSRFLAANFIMKLMSRKPPHHLSDVHLSPQQHLLLYQFLYCYGEGLRGLSCVLVHAVENEIVPLVLLKVIPELVLEPFFSIKDMPSSF